MEVLLVAGHERDRQSPSNRHGDRVGRVCNRDNKRLVVLGKTGFSAQSSSRSIAPVSVMPSIQVAPL